MAVMSKQPTAKDRRPPSAAAERVAWLLDQVWDGNRSAMARDVGCSPSVLVKIAAGSQAPGRRLLTAISSHPKVNPAWLLAGKGEPLLAVSSETPEAGWPVPIARQPLPGAPGSDPERLSGESFPTAGAFYRPSRYWLELQPNSPILRIQYLSLQPRDLLLVETDNRQWTEMHLVHEQVCVVQGDQGSLNLAFISHDEGDQDDPSEHLYITLPSHTEGSKVEREFVIQLAANGASKFEERPSRGARPPLPRHEKVLISQVVGLSTMVVRR